MGGCAVTPLPDPRPQHVGPPRSSVNACAMQIGSPEGHRPSTSDVGRSAPLSLLPVPCRVATTCVGRTPPRAAPSDRRRRLRDPAVGAEFARLSSSAVAASSSLVASLPTRPTGPGSETACLPAPRRRALGAVCSPFRGFYLQGPIRLRHGRSRSLPLLSRTGRRRRTRGSPRWRRERRGASRRLARPDRSGGGRRLDHFDGELAKRRFDRAADDLPPLTVKIRQRALYHLQHFRGVSVRYRGR